MRVPLRRADERLRSTCRRRMADRPCRARSLRVSRSLPDCGARRPTTGLLCRPTVPTDRAYRAAAGGPGETDPCDRIRRPCRPPCDAEPTDVRPTRPYRLPAMPLPTDRGDRPRPTCDRDVPFDRTDVRPTVRDRPCRYDRGRRDHCHGALDRATWPTAV
ncbi:uncharacterized protein A4U43_C01F30240 [Asparagus officinalis]|uniref:Uncharacterized protein n=1 Tax=Asparagus officinalis TaxID=4686 RepID=A0A5P1FV35_ASPOF|nr:uncharacterized protein A4U43_C01F30240 [Asparagus officinalis]